MFFVLSSFIFVLTLSALSNDPRRELTRMTMQTSLPPDRGCAALDVVGLAYWPLSMHVLN